MATRSEQFHADEQRKGPSGKIRAERSKPGVPLEDRSHEHKHAGRKATYAIEPETSDGARPSRKSTRASANRAKPDTNLNLREQMVKGSPEARARKAKARTTRVRGSAQAP